MAFFGLSKNNTGYTELSDEELLLRFQSTYSMEIIGELYRRYSHLVLGVCLKYLKNQEDARDATMYIFEKLIRDLKTNKVENFKSWLYTVSKNHCLMEIRKEAATQRHLEKIEENPDEKFVEIWDELHLINVDQEKRLTALNYALTQLNHEQRTCVQLVYLENKSYKETAEITGMDVVNVKSHIQNGKRNLRILLEKRNDTE
jgi:RNA polymerase sigma factor (sigma-70 family)